MHVKNIVPIIVSIILGLIAVFLVNRYMGKEERIEAAKEYFLVADQNLKKGDVLTKENVTARSVIATDAPKIAIEVPTPASAAKVYGQKVMRDIEKDDFILYTDLGSLHISPLASAVPPGHWAVTIGVDNIGGLAGMVRPGDEVALMVTLAVPVKSNAGSGDLTAGPNMARQMVPATYVLYPRIKVIAVGQQVAGEITPLTRDVKGGGEVTFLVTREQAQELTHVRQFGRLSLAMRRSDDDSLTERVAGGVTDAEILRSLMHQEE